MLFTPMAIDYATVVRGYNAYGGEYLLPLLGVLIVFLIETAIDINKSLKENGDEEDAGGISTNDRRHKSR